MARGEGACLVCGKSLVYTEKAEKLECQMCHQIFESYACCEDGHYVCDSCHEKKGVEVIMEETGKTTSVNPIEIMQEIMENPYMDRNIIFLSEQHFWRHIRMQAEKWILLKMHWKKCGIVAVNIRVVPVECGAAVELQ